MALKHVQFRGHTLNQRTIDMLLEAERNVRVSRGMPKDYRFEITQGSYNTSVPASAMTHAGGGAVDIRAKTLTAAQRVTVLRELRPVGFAAWLRHAGGSFPVDHFHAIAIGDPDLHPQAQDQVVDYRHGRNGLANNGPDDGPADFRHRTWDEYRGKRKLPDAIPSSTPVAKKRDIHLTVRALRMAAAGEPIDHTFGFDAEQFMAVAFTGLRVISDTTFTQWRTTREKHHFVAAVKAVQRHLELTDDGDPGPVTVGNLEAHGYFVTP